MNHGARITFADRFGDTTLRYLKDTYGVVSLTVRSIYEAYTAPRSARTCIQQILLQQMKFTGVDALAITAISGAIIGAIVTFQSMAVLPQVGAADFLGKLMTMVVIRELGPLLVAFIVIGRSGTAISVELGTMAVGGEVAALRSLGIPIRAYVVFPRMAGATVATLVLLVYFDIAALLGGFVASNFIVHMPPSFFLESLADHVEVVDILATIMKGVLFGVIVSSIACHYGLAVQRATTEIPQAAQRAVVMAIVCCLAADLFLSLVSLWI